MRTGMLPRVRLDLKDPGVRRTFFKLMLPAILGVSVSQISLLINTIIRVLPRKRFGVLGFTTPDRLMEFPAGLLGVASVTILLPLPVAQSRGR